MGQSKMVKKNKLASAPAAGAQVSVNSTIAAPLSDRASTGFAVVATALSDSSPTGYAMAEADIQSNPVALPVGPSTARNEQKSPLLKLPTEIKLKIWNMSVTVEEPITPIQLTSKSNKFLWSTSQIVKTTKIGHYPIIEKKVKSAVAPLDVVALSAVCKEMYEDIALTHLFYKNNVFDFAAPNTCINTYLVAITEPRRHAICSIKYTWEIIERYFSSRNTDEEMMMIASCKGLQSLKLNFSYDAPFIYHSLSKSDTCGMKYAGAAVQGLKVLALNVPDSPGYPRALFAHELDHKERKETMIKSLKDILAESQTIARTGKYNIGLFRAIQEKADLDVHGEGRLSKDKKPSLISSRTRGQVQKAENLSPEGILPTRETPKYDFNGYLTWFIESIKNCRQVPSDDGTIGVEFQVKCQKHNNGWRHSVSETTTSTLSWEDVSVLNSNLACYLIATFYEKHVDMPGKQEVLDYWRSHINNGEEDAKPASKRYEKRIETVIKRDARLKNKAAALEAREAAKTARTAKKTTKAAKVTKCGKKAA